MPVDRRSPDLGSRLGVIPASAMVSVLTTLESISSLFPSDVDEHVDAREIKHDTISTMEEALEEEVVATDSNMGGREPWSRALLDATSRASSEVGMEIEDIGPYNGLSAQFDASNSPQLSSSASHLSAIPCRFNAGSGSSLVIWGKWGCSGVADGAPEDSC